MADDPWAEADLPGEDGTVRVPPQRRFGRRRAKPWTPPKGNVKREDVGPARTAVIKTATGGDRPEPAQWREELKQGDRTKAASALATGRHTHNSGSGFGLA